MGNWYEVESVDFYCAITSGDLFVMADEVWPMTLKDLAHRFGFCPATSRDRYQKIKKRQTNRN